MTIEPYVPIIIGILAFTFLIIGIKLSKGYIIFEHIFLLMVELFFIVAMGLIVGTYSTGITVALFITSLGVFTLTFFILFLQYFQIIWDYWHPKVESS